ncbi:hypothetical protein [Spirosoma aerophilum]
MPAASRGVVYSLITVVVVLLLGIAAILGVSYHRHQRLEDAAIDLQHNLSQQEGQIKALRQQLDDCDTIQPAVSADSGWGTTDRVDSVRSVSQITHSTSTKDWPAVGK